MTYIINRFGRDDADGSDYADERWEDPGPGEFWVELYYRASDGRGFIRERQDYYSERRAEEVALYEVERNTVRPAVGAKVTCDYDPRYVRRCGLIPRLRDIRDARKR